MSGVRNFTDLHIWKRARAWSKRIFELSLLEPFAGDRRLTVQVNDSTKYPVLGTQY